MVPWAISIGGRAPQDTAALLRYLRDVVETLEERFDVELEWATMSGVDLLPRQRSSRLVTLRADVPLSQAVRDVHLRPHRRSRRDLFELVYQATIAGGGRGRLR